jgi:hypothetical protein
MVCITNLEIHNRNHPGLAINQFNSHVIQDKLEKSINGVDPNKSVNCIIRKIKDLDVLGLEEVMEIKKRFTSIKCISSTAELYKISLVDFIIHLKNSSQIKDVAVSVKERKNFLKDRVNNIINVKYTQSYFKPDKIKTLDTIYKEHENKHRVIKMNPIRLHLSTLNNKNSRNINRLGEYDNVSNVLSESNKTLYDKSVNLFKDSIYSTLKHLKTERPCTFDKNNELIVIESYNNVERMTTISPVKTMILKEKIKIKNIPEKKKIPLKFFDKIKLSKTRQDC